MVHLGLMGSQVLSWDNLKIACTESSLCFSLSPSFVLRQRVLVCKATASTSSSLELILKFNGVRASATTACRMDRAISGSFSFGSCRGSGLKAWTSFAPLLCSACRHGSSLWQAAISASSAPCWTMSMGLSREVPTSCRRIRGLCVSLLLCPCLFLPARCFFSHVPLDWSVVVICWTGITILCEPFVPFSLVECWFSKFGWSCPSGSRKMQHSATVIDCGSHVKRVLTRRFFFSFSER